MTEWREVLYRWPPWFGRAVLVHQFVDKGLTVALRCSIDGMASGRWLELPAWMFDRSVWVPITLANSPRVHLAALEGLQKLLAGVGPLPRAIIATGCGALRDPPHQNRRRVNAEPAPRFQNTASSSRPVQSVRSPTRRTAMAASAARDSLGGERSDDAPAERTSIRASRSHRRAAR